MEAREHHWGYHQSASQRPNKALETVEGTCERVGKVRVGQSRDCTTGLEVDAGILA